MHDFLLEMISIGDARSRLRRQFVCLGGRVTLRRGRIREIRMASPAGDHLCLHTSGRKAWAWTGQDGEVVGEDRGPDVWRGLDHSGPQWLSSPCDSPFSSRPISCLAKRFG